MNIRRHIFAVAATAMLATGAYAADIKLGVSGPFTGGSSSMGVSMRDGVRLATKEINAAGGINGNKIVLIERDDEAKNERGVQIAQELINNEKVVATLGYINTGVALASQRFYQDAKIPVMNNVATGSIVTKQFPNAAENYIFRNAAADNIQAPMVAKEVPFVTIKQVIDKLHNFRTGLSIDRNLVMSMLNPDKIKIISKIEGDRIYLSNPMGSTRSLKKDDKQKEKEHVEDMAKKQAAKNMG